MCTTGNNIVYITAILILFKIVILPYLQPFVAMR